MQLVAQWQINQQINQQLNQQVNQQINQQILRLEFDDTLCIHHQPQLQRLARHIGPRVLLVDKVKPEKADLAVWGADALAAKKHFSRPQDSGTGVSSGRANKA